MSRSANEVMNLATKAARGGGAPPGQAADFGRAVVCHLVAGREVSTLEQALNALPKGPILSLPLAFARILERGENGQAHGDVPCNDTPDLCRSYAEALPFAQSFQQVADDLYLQIQTTQPATRPVVKRVTLPEPFAVWMAELAARTLVPESEASRLSGAGAGLTDND